MHAKLERLFIHNYRCFESFELRPEGRGLLLGYNGTGKTSLFDVFAALQDLMVWNKDVSDVFPRNTLALPSGSFDQRFELDIESRWGIFQYALHVSHDPIRNTSKITSEKVAIDGRPLYEYAQGAVQL